LGKKYSEVKHEDKFHEALSHGWERVQRYVVPAGIAVLAVLVAATVWMFIAQHRTSGRERAWAERFEIGHRYATNLPDDEAEAKEQTRKLLAELEDFARKHQGRDAAAITLLEVARTHLALAGGEQGKDDSAAKDHLQRAAAAAELFLEHYPGHPYAAAAHYDAGKARLDLGNTEEALTHFDAARQGSDVAFLRALAGLQAGLCYEKLGRIDKAREAFETVRDSKGPDDRPTWCAQQAEYHLARLRRGASQES